MKLPQEIQKEILRIYQDGASMEQVAQQLSVSLNSVTSLVGRAGLTRQASFGLRPGRWARQAK